MHAQIQPQNTSASSPTSCAAAAAVAAAAAAAVVGGGPFWLNNPTVRERQLLQRESFLLFICFTAAKSAISTMHPPQYAVYTRGDQYYYAYPAAYDPYQQQQLHVQYSQQQQQQQEQLRPRKCCLRLGLEAVGWCLSVALCVVCSAVGGAVSCCRAAADEAELLINQQQQQQLQLLQQRRLQQQRQPQPQQETQIPRFYFQEKQC
ncbi:hypothetical protein Efla_005262 [Eimeria flavescens]